MSLGRRSFVKTNWHRLSDGPWEAPRFPSAVDSSEPMKITRIDAVTFRKDMDVGGGFRSSEDGTEF